VDEALLYGDTGGEMFVKAQGHVTAARCPELKARIFARLETAPAVSAVYFDLSGCEYMDSTFLGLIVGANKRFKALSGRTLRVLHANPTCLGLLRTIGVTRLVEISNDEVPFPQSMETIGPGPRATAEFILDAHEQLSEISDENRARFTTLTKALKDSLGKQGGD
jgi:anti-anti-sigma factor